MTAGEATLDKPNTFKILKTIQLLTLKCGSRGIHTPPWKVTGNPRGRGGRSLKGKLSEEKCEAKLEFRWG